MKIPDLKFKCPFHNKELVLHQSEKQESLTCPEGCCFEKYNGVYRFIELDNYASSFGIQWNHYKLTQLDSHTGTSLSRDRLVRCVGGSMDVVKGKRVLEAGCGAGRFTELLLEAGAELVSIDLSSAVEANYENFKDKPNYFVAQASILDLPFEEEQFDIVICLGVIQHTPSSEDTIACLIKQLKPGGMLVIDHYPPGIHESLGARILRPFFLKLPSKTSFKLCKWLVALLWPLHRLVFKRKGRRGLRTLMRYSPIIDYQGAYPLSDSLQKEWAMLDTHDALTDYYKHKKSVEDIREILSGHDLEDIHVVRANGVEARARKQQR